MNVHSRKASSLGKLIAVLATITTVGLGVGEPDEQLATTESGSAEQTIAYLRSGAEWAVDPLSPGPDLPPVGRSLFDFVVTASDADGPRYDVPYPFPALLEKIATDLEPHAYFDAPLSRVLIPLGRSLQRNAAAPDFFEYPRAVVAVDTETAVQAGKAGKHLKHRLFLGYLEKANVVEVISYNEEAARFEFQVVKDYRPGGDPQVFYANRELCTACHQNGAPIFAKPLWDETNANRNIAAGLQSKAREFYGFPVEQSVDVAYAVDNATDQANLISAYQRIWREACGDGAAAPAVHCRASLFAFLLQYRLDGRRNFDLASERFRDHLLPRFRAQWQQHWPHGLAIPDPDLPNRRPLGDTVRVASQDAPLSGQQHDPALLLRLSDVPAHLEPLNPRPAAEVWLLDQPQRDLTKIIAGLAEFITAADVSRLDVHLVESRGRAATPEATYHSDCRFGLHFAWPTFDRLSIDCTTPGSRAVQPEIAIEGRIYAQARQGTMGVISRLRMAGDEYLDLPVIAWRQRRVDHGWVLELTLSQPYAQLQPRRGDGSAIATIILRPETDWEVFAEAGQFSGSAVIVVAHDFAAVEAAIERIAARTLDGRSDAFSAKPFRRAVVMRALFRELDMPELAWCCTDAGALPPARLDHASSAPNFAAVTSEDVGLFRHYCANCHGTSDPFPPNFLAGEPAEVEANLGHCAERIFYRLSMWQVDAGDRDKIAMPPNHALHRLDIALVDWSRHTHLAALQAYSRRDLESRTGVAPRWEEFIEQDYSGLQSCLPDGR